MDRKDNKVTLYTVQAPIVMKTLNKDKIYHVKERYIENKYKDVSNIFFECYKWFVGEAEKIVKIPSEAEYPIWTFINPRYVDGTPGNFLLTLEVPIDRVVFFDMRDWNIILNLGYIPQDKDDERDFEKKLELYNISHTSDIYLSPYYPHLKSKIKKSWKKLFRYDQDFKEGKISSQYLQGSIWEVRKSQIKDIKRL